MSVNKLSRLPLGLAFSRVTSQKMVDARPIEQEKQIHVSHSVRSGRVGAVNSMVFSADGEQLVYQHSGTGHGYGHGVKEPEVWMMLESARAKAFDESVKNVISFKLEP